MLMKKIVCAACGVLAMAGIAQAADENVKKIMFVGDSISVGVGASNKENRYSTVAVKMLNEAAGRTAYKELNIAISGSTMTDQPWPSKAASGFPYRLKQVFDAKPDIVVVQHAVNDNAVGCSLGEIGYSYRTFIKEVKAKLPKAKIVCMTGCPSQKRSAASDRMMDQINAIIQEVAARENTLLVQINQAINFRAELFKDNYHPNDAGHKVMAETLVKALQENRVMSSDNFDLVVKNPGEYRICGWVLHIPTQAAKGGYTVLRNVGKKGWSYSAPSTITLISPFRYYFKKQQAEITGGLTAQFSYHAYQKKGSWKLPATGGKLLEVKNGDVL